MDRYSILVVEDDADTREGLASLLESNGYDVVATPDGAEALGRLRNGLRPSVILLDLRMPEKNGFQFRVEQVLDPELSQIPVVVYSGDPDAFSHSAMLGAIAHLGKPIDSDELLAAIRSCCPS